MNYYHFGIPCVVSKREQCNKNRLDIAFLAASKPLGIGRRGECLHKTDGTNNNKLQGCGSCEFRDAKGPPEGVAVGNLGAGDLRSSDYGRNDVMFCEKVDVGIRAEVTNDRRPYKCRTSHRLRKKSVGRHSNRELIEDVNRKSREERKVFFSEGPFLEEKKVVELYNEKRGRQRYLNYFNTMAYSEVKI